MSVSRFLVAAALIGTPCAALAENGKWNCYGDTGKLDSTIVVSNGKVLRIVDSIKKIAPDAMDLGKEVVWQEHFPGKYNDTWDYTLDLKTSASTPWLIMHSQRYNVTITTICRREKELEK